MLVVEKSYFQWEFVCEKYNEQATEFGFEICFCDSSVKQKEVSENTLVEVRNKSNNSIILRLDQLNLFFRCCEFIIPHLLG
jgi:hypothetical protein